VTLHGFDQYRSCARKTILNVNPTSNTALGLCTVAQAAQLLALFGSLSPFIVPPCGRSLRDIRGPQYHTVLCPTLADLYKHFPWSGHATCTRRRVCYSCGSTYSLLLIGPILWGHSGPLCHALSLSSSSSSSWTSMRACDSSETW